MQLWLARTFNLQFSHNTPDNLIINGNHEVQWSLKPCFLCLIIAISVHV
jgi:hypothetical protein